METGVSGQNGRLVRRNAVAETTTEQDFATILVQSMMMQGTAPDRQMRKEAAIPTSVQVSNQ